MRSIDTYYNRNYFRSRLEARWAVCFDTLGVQWEYEPQKFVLEGGSIYMPDFYFPKYDLFAEVKPFPQDDVRWKLFDRQLVLMFGNPHFTPMPCNFLEGKVIPFADLSAEKYGHFWICAGDEDWGDDMRTIFGKAVLKANTFRFESPQNRLL